MNEKECLLLIKRLMDKRHDLHLEIQTTTSHLLDHLESINLLLAKLLNSLKSNDPH